MSVVEDWDTYTRLREQQGKKYRDPLYNYVKLGPSTGAAALDTRPLQRLRRLKQLGCTDQVFQCGEHSRFGHSLGTAHLAHTMGMHLHMMDPGLEMRPDDLRVLEVAGLCHDVGHGPFSHVFEHEFMKALGDTWRHEDMSARLIDLVFDEACLDLGPADAVARVQDVVGAGKVALKAGWAGQGFMLQIVANALNGVDVDKFDYLRRDAYYTGVQGGYEFAQPLIEAARVVDEGRCIGYRNGMEPKLHGLFSARADMHQQVYTHRKVKSLEYVVVDALLEANGPLRISERTRSPEDFLGLTDCILWEIRNSRDPALARAAALVGRIERHDGYKFCAEVEVPQAVVEGGGWADMTAEEVVGHQDHNSGIMLRPEDVRVHNLKIDFSMGVKHPARHVPIWHKDGTLKLCTDLPFEPKICQERKVRVYLARQTSSPEERAKAIQAVHAALKRAAAARLGSSARVVCASACQLGGAWAGQGAASVSGASGPRWSLARLPAGAAASVGNGNGSVSFGGAAMGLAPAPPAGRGDGPEAASPPAVAEGQGSPPQLGRGGGDGGADAIGRGGGAMTRAPISTTPEKPPPGKRPRDASPEAPERPLLMQQRRRRLEEQAEGEAGAGPSASRAAEARGGGGGGDLGSGGGGAGGALDEDEDEDEEGEPMLLTQESRRPATG